MNISASLPNFIVIGAPKSGTTSLYNYLKQHPDIYLPDQKELHYFAYKNLKENSNGPGDKKFLTHVCSTRQEYKKHYLSVNTESAIGEVSPSYLYYSDVSDRIFSELGHVKIIILLRNPVQKAYSQYIHLVSEKRETLLFYDALMAEQSRIDSGWLDIWRYAESTLYTERINKFISVFGKDKVKILLFDELVSRPDEFMRDLFEFLQVDNNFYCDTTRSFNQSRIPKLKILHDLMKRPNSVKTVIKKIVPETIRFTVLEALMNLNTRKKPVMNSRSREYLREYFSADVKNLQQLLGRDLQWLN